MNSEKKSATTKGKHSLTQKNYTIPKENRQDSYIQRPVNRKKEILEVLGDESLTARQIQSRLGYTDGNAVKPRLSELRDEGLIKAVGKAYDVVTERNVTIWRKADA